MKQRNFITYDTFWDAGIVLYGAHGYVAGMAKLLEVNERTIHQWKAKGRVPFKHLEIIAREVGRRNEFVNGVLTRILAHYFDAFSRE